MHKEVISDKEGIFFVVLLIIGTNSIMLTGLSAEKSIWLGNIIGIFMALPMVLIYARLHEIFPNKDLFDIIDICFGRCIGKIIMLFIFWYIFENIASPLTLCSQFVVTVSLTKTPQVVFEAVMIFLCIWIVKEGIEVMCRWSSLFLLLVIMIMLIASILLIPNMQINNLRPMFINGIKPILKGAFETFLFPFGQLIVLTMIFSNFHNKKSPYKIYTLGLLIGGGVILLISVMVILVLGINIASSIYYPTYATISMMDIGNLLQRQEIISGSAFILGAFIKISIYLIAACRSTAKIFGYGDYRFIVTPIALLAVNLSYFEFDSVMHYFEWSSEIWNYYIIPFQVILPIIIWIAAEINKKKVKT